MTNDIKEEKFRKFRYQYLFTRRVEDWTPKNKERYFTEYMIHKRKCREHYKNLEKVMKLGLTKYHQIWGIK